MKIIIATSDNRLSSGAFNSAVFVAKGLIESGNDVLVVVPDDGNGDLLLKTYKIPFIKIESEDWIVENSASKVDKKEKLKKIKKKNFEALREWRRLLKKKKPDVLHINTSYHFISAIAAIGTRTKVVWHLREFLEEDQDRHILKRALGIKLINHSDAIICISKAIYNKYKDVLDSKRLNVIYNGVDVTKYYSQGRQILENDCINMLCVGSVWEKKGQFELAWALYELKKAFPESNFNLSLVGYCDKTNRKNLGQIFKKGGMPSCLSIEGEQKDTPKYYNKADIVFTCSTSEAFGRVTVEGMMSGALAIGKNCAGTKEIIQNGRSGFLYNDQDDLTRIVRYVSTHRKECKTIAKAGQKRAIHNFTADLNCKNIIKLYKKLLGI